MIKFFVKVVNVRKIIIRREEEGFWLCSDWSKKKDFKLYINS